MPTQTYDFTVPSEYTLSGTQISGGSVTLAPLQLSGTVRGDVFFKGIRLDAFAATVAENGGTVLFGLEIDTVLTYHDGVAWVASDGSPGQLKTLAQVQAQVGSVLDMTHPLVKPYVRLSRTSNLDPSPQVDLITADYTVLVPNRQVLLATDAAVALNTGVGGAASPGEARVTLDPLLVEYEPGTNSLWVFRNGILASAADITEEDSTHVVFSFLPDAVAPWIDELEFRVARAGSSAYIAPPTSLVQARPPERPDNFGGSYEFS